MTQDMALYPFGLFPTVNGHPYADYPSLYNFFSYLTTFGGRWMNQWSLALPTILLASYILGMTALIGERIQKNLGVCAALFSLLSFEYINIFLAFSIDVPVAAAAVTIVYFLQKHQCGVRALPVYLLMLAFAFVVRGPFGLIMTGAVTAGYLIGDRRWKALIYYGFAGAGVTALCAAGTFYLIHLQGGEELWKNVLDWQISSRMKKGNLFYYFTNPMGSFAAMTIVAIAVLVMKRRELLKQPLASWVLWALLPMILLSIPGCKHLRYMTPVLPAFALIAAYGWVNLDSSKIAWGLKWVVRIMDKLMYPAGLLTLSGLLIAGFVMPKSNPPVIHFAVAALIMTLIYFRMKKLDGNLMPLARLAFLFVTLVSMGLFPFDAMTENSENFVREVESKRAGRLYLYHMGPDHDDLKYVFQLSPEKRSEILYLFDTVANTESLLRKMYPSESAPKVIPGLSENDVIVTSEKYYAAFTILAEKAGKEPVLVHKGELGHRDSVAVRLIPKESARMNP